MLFPPEVSGVVILLVGLSNAATGFKTPFPADGSAVPGEVAVAGITGLVMIVASLFGAGRVQLLCGLIGILAGYIAAFGLGVLNMSNLSPLSDLPLLAVPWVSLAGWSVTP